MDPITLAILAGLSSGARVEGDGPVAQGVVQAYCDLRGLLARTFGQDGAVMKALRGVEDNSEYAWRIRALEAELAATGADDDPELLEAARGLTDAVRALPAGGDLIEKIAAGPPAVGAGAGAGEGAGVRGEPPFGRSVTGPVLQGFDTLDTLDTFAVGTRMPEETGAERWMAIPPDAVDRVEAFEAEETAADDSPADAVFAPGAWARAEPTEAEVGVAAPVGGAGAEPAGSEVGADFPRAVDRAEAFAPEEAGAAAAEPAEPEPEAGLLISQWLRNEEGETLGMSSRVNEQKAYWYAVEIGRRARAEASTEVFHETRELQEAETAFVAVEVESPLVAGGNEQRWVEYRRGEGFGAQFFQLHLQGKTGRYPLIVRLVHGNRVVYRREWSITVGRQERNRVAESVATTTTAELGKVYSTPYRLVAKAESKRLGLMPPKMGMADGTVQTDKRALQEVHQTNARRLLKEYSEARRGGAAADRAKVAAFLRAMAVWGLRAKELLLGEREEDNALVRKMFTWMRPGDGLLIETDIPSFPWEWIYDGERPPVAEDLDDAELKELVGGFWGVRYDLEFLPDIDLDRMGLEEHRVRVPAAEVLAAVNRSAHPVEGDGTVSDLEELGRHGGLGVQIAIESKTEVVEGLRRAQKANVYYFYCHHKAGNAIDAFGFLRPEDSSLYLKGEKDEELTVEFLKDEEMQPFPPGEAPLVILNACGTAQGEDYVPSGFVRYFLTDLNAAAVVGTVAEVPAADAREFGRQLLERWLGGAAVGAALLDLRHEWMLEAAIPNPFALYYTLHGSGEVRLEH